MVCHPEVVFAAIYDVFLVLAAWALLRVGRRLQRHPISSSLEKDVSWSHWEAGQFRTGLATTLLALAFFIAVVAGWAYHDPLEIGLLGLILIVLIFIVKNSGTLAWLARFTKLPASSAQK